MRLIDCHKGYVHSVAFSPDGKLLATADTDGTALLWELPDLAVRARLETPGLEGRRYYYALSFSPDGRRLAVGFGIDQHAHPRPWRSAGVWETEPPYRFTALGSDAWACFRVGFSPDGRTLAALRLSPDCSKNSVLRWEVGSWLPYPCPGRERNNAFQFAFAPDGSLYATGGQPGSSATDGHVQIWDTYASHLIAERTLGPGSVRAVAFSPDGRALAVAVENAVSLWKVPTLVLLREPPAPPGGRPVNALAYSPDGQLLAVAGDGSLVRICDARLRERAAFRWDIGNLRSVVFAPDGLKLAASSDDGKVVLWDVE